CDSKFSLFKCVVTISFRVHINIRDCDETNDNKPRKNYTGHPRVKVNKHFLKTKEVPRSFSRVWCPSRVSRFFKRSFEHDRPDDKENSPEDNTEKFSVNEVRPSPNFFTIFRSSLNRTFTGGNSDIILVSFIKSKPR